MNKQINLFVGGSTGYDDVKDYLESALKIGELACKHNYRLLYDGCQGLPGLVYAKYLSLNKANEACIYHAMHDSVVNDYALREVFTYQSDVTKAFIENADAMIFMNGGLGTLAEIAGALDCKKNYEINSPIVLLNINHVLDTLVNFLDIYNQKHLYYVTDSVDDAFDYIEKN